MGKIFEKGQPEKGSKAGVIHWELEVKFLCKEQRDLFVGFLISSEIFYDFTSTYSLDEGYYYVSIDDMSWGENLKPVAKYLSSIDFNC